MNSGHRPFFSVLIPSYNRPEYIAECVESVLANEGEDYELLLSDDASPSADAVEQALQPYLAHSNIRFYRQQNNLGEPGNRNFLVSQATGKYNLILGDDDKLLPYALRTIRQYIKENPDIDLYGFGYTVIDEKGKPCYSRSAPKGFVIDLGHPKLIRRMFEGIWLPFLIFHPATYCCKRGVETEIPYRKDVSIADDYMFLLECLNKGKRLYVLPECLMSYRWFQSREKTKQINQSSDGITVMEAFMKVYYAFQSRADLHPSLSGFIRGSKYRKRFLHDFIILSMPRNLERATMDLEPDHQKELGIFGFPPQRYIVRITTAVRAAYEIMQQFGVRGLMYCFHLGLGHVKHKSLHACAFSSWVNGLRKLLPT